MICILPISVSNDISSVDSCTVVVLSGNHPSRNSSQQRVKAQKSTSDFDTFWYSMWVCEC